MKCLIDADILVYEIASCGQFIDEDSGELIVRKFDYVAELLDQRVKEIEGECWATEPSLLFLSNDETLQKQSERVAKTYKTKAPPYIPNFRYGLAKSKPYKGNRKQEKPFHRDNIRAYMLEEYECVVANGLEADDLLAVEQTLAAPLTTVICSRDKDLRMVEGLHYGWPCGKQPQYGPKPSTKLGELHYDTGKNKLTGTGSKFFYSQVLTGDTTDNYSGLAGCGPKRAFNLLDSAGSEGDLFRATSGAYRDKLGDGWREAMLEQARLAWMVRELNEDGSPVMWEMLDEIG